MSRASDSLGERIGGADGPTAEEPVRGVAPRVNDVDGRAVAMGVGWHAGERADANQPWVPVIHGVLRETSRKRWV